MGKYDKKDKKKRHRSDSEDSYRRSRSRSRERERTKEKNRPRQRSRHSSHSSESNRSHRRNNNRSYDNTYDKQYDEESEEEKKSNRGQPTWRSESQETRNLCIDQIACDGSTIEKILTNVSIEIGASLPDEVDLRNGNAYVKYPSNEAAAMSLDHLKGWLNLKGQKYRIDFFPYRRANNYLTQDWYCDKCQYKNFSKRNKCNRCDNTRNTNCKLAYTSSSSRNKKNQQQDQSGNCSLMVRGNIITELEQSSVLCLFEGLAPIRDIRMIKDKATGRNKDFAFVQFFTPEDTANIFKMAKEKPFQLRGEPVTILYSKNRKEERDHSVQLDPGRTDDYGHMTGPPPRRRREPRETPIENYSQREREREIQMEKEKPLITMEQLKERKQAEMRKLAQHVSSKQMTVEQSKRRQAELDLKKWQKQMKQASETLYICPICIRKFKDEQQLKNHENMSQRHKALLEIVQLAL